MLSHMSEQISITSERLRLVRSEKQHLAAQTKQRSSTDFTETGSSIDDAGLTTFSADAAAEDGEQPTPPALPSITTAPAAR